MNLNDCVTGLTWYPVRQKKASAGKMARGMMAEKHLIEAVWVYREFLDRGRRKASFAIAGKSFLGKVSAAAAFSSAARNGIIVERLANGFFWIAVSIDGVPVPGFDNEHMRDDAEAVLRSTIEDMQIGLDDIYVPQGFTGYHEGCLTFAELTANTSVSGVSFKKIERGINMLTIVSASVSIAVISAVGGYFWWEHHLAAQAAIKSQAMLRLEMSHENQEKALRTEAAEHNAAIQKALKAYTVAMGKLENDWGQSMSIDTGEYVGSMISRITPAWGWSPTTFVLTGDVLRSVWVSDIPGHPDYIAFRAQAMQEGWKVASNAYYSQITLSRSVPDAAVKLMVNPGFSGLGLILNSLPSTWKMGNTIVYSLLPYLQKQFMVSGASMSSLALTLQILGKIPSMRISSIKADGRGWEMNMSFFEKTTQPVHG